VKIDLKSNTGYVVGGGVVVKVNGTSPHKVKIAAKKVLEDLGVEFEVENREVE
jgi:hypothetical protein